MNARSTLGVAPAMLLLAAALPPAAAQDGAWLAICARCPSPAVVKTSGLGTARATAEARMTKADVTGPDGPCTPQDAACIQAELRKVYRAAADCTTGRITTTEGATYTLAGLWDDSDVGAGRTKWRADDGQVVGRDNASNGLAIAQQWEVLCPGRVSAQLIASAAAAGAEATGAGPGPKAGAAAAGRGAKRPAAAPLCAPGAPCAEVGRFAMTVTDFRTSLAQPAKVLTATTRFQNKLDREVVLAYVPGSGAAIDERGNRYVVNDADIRGIGSITSRAVDDKFVLEPGQGADARFTFLWNAGRAVYGTTFDVELVVREVVPLDNGQVELGAEHPLRIAGLTDGVRGAAARPAAAPPAAATQAGSSGSTGSAGTVDAAPGPAPASPADACAASRLPCHDAGPFTATLAGFNASVVKGRHHLLKIQLALRNNTAQPLILAYKASTSGAIDDQGNFYGWGRPGTYDTSVQGIGIVSARQADTSFVLRPGETRTASFGVIRFESGPAPQGRTFALDTVVAELRLLPNGTQSETVREHAVHLADLSAARGTVAATDAGPTDAAAAASDVKKAAEAVKNLFKRGKK